MVRPSAVGGVVMVRRTGWDDIGFDCGKGGVIVDVLSFVLSFMLSSICCGAS
jgi:hypothetical protein